MLRPALGPGVGLAVGLVLAACSAPTETSATSSNDAVSAGAVATPTNAKANANANAPTAAHFVCTTTAKGQWPLELLTQANGTVDATYAGGAVVLTGALQHGTASLGQFLSGVYAVSLDANLLAGNAGTATLDDDEGPNNGGTSTIAYACAPAAPVATAFDCTPAEASQYPLALTTSAGGTVVADYAGGAISWTGRLQGGDSDLGRFLSGEYGVHVDTNILNGHEGTASLLDDEGPKNGGVDALAYTCKPKTR